MVTHRVRDLQVRGRVSGGGTPVVLVHGLGVSGAYLLPTVRVLASEHRVALPDMPGFGLSERPATPLDVPALADVIGAWCRLEFGPAAVTLVGHSFGCQVAARLAADRPSLVGRVVLVGPTVDPDARSLTRQLLRWVRDIPREPWSLVPVVASDYFTTDPRRLLATARVMLADRIEDALPLIDVPAIVVRGERDPIVSQSWAEKAANLLPRAEVAVIATAGHAVNFSHPRELAAVVRALRG